MSRIKLLLEVVEDMHSLADSLSALASAMADSDSSTEDAAPQAEAAALPDRSPDKQPTVSLVEVRTKLGELSRAGYTAQVRDLIHKYGAERLGDIDPSYYEALLYEAEGLTDAT
jgi:hypothetical protein